MPIPSSWHPILNDQLAINEGYHNPLLKLNNLLECITGLRKTLYLLSLVYYKRLKKKKEHYIKKHMGQGPKGPELLSLLIRGALDL